VGVFFFIVAAKIGKVRLPAVSAPIQASNGHFFPDTKIHSSKFQTQDLAICEIKRLKLNQIAGRSAIAIVLALNPL